MRSCDYTTLTPTLSLPGRGRKRGALCKGEGTCLLHCRNNFQPRPHGSSGIVFMGARIAKVDQQPIAEILGKVALMPLNYLGAGLLILLHDLAQVFRIKLG